MHEVDAKKPRGRSAIQAAHAGISTEDESRLDLRISDIYEVDYDEAAEIHLNYHVDRIVSSLTSRCAEKGLSANALPDVLRYLDITASASQVTKGKLTEVAAVDALVRSILKTKESFVNDRYMNFYR